jgi:hypothetical protein
MYETLLMIFSSECKLEVVVYGAHADCHAPTVFL